MGAKNHSPSLLWMNEKSAKWQKDVLKEKPEWKIVNEKILFNWKLNMDKLVCEVLETKADIITFQEVDTFRAKDEKYNLQDRMAGLGYEGIHQPKIGEGNGLFGYVDGPAIFWDANKFERAGPMKIITFRSKYEDEDLEAGQKVQVKKGGKWCIVTMQRGELEGDKLINIRVRNDGRLG